MRVGEPEYAIKFMAKIPERDLDEAASILRESVAPAMRSSGFSELIVVARRREFARLDPEAPGIASSNILGRLAAEAPPHESVLGYARRKLPARLGKDVPTGYAHAMVLHNKKKRNPALYEKLRRERLAEQERLEGILLAGENWQQVAGVQLDCYAIYGSEADLKADTLDLENRKVNVPYSARLLSREFDHLLLAKLTGIYHTVVHRALREPSGGMFAMQTRLAVDSARVAETTERITSLLMPAPDARAGSAGALVLESRREGFSAGSPWSPTSLAEHGSDPCEVHTGTRHTQFRDEPIFYEVITVWKTETDLLERVDQLSSLGPAGESPADNFSIESPLHTEYGALLLLQ